MKQKIIKVAYAGRISGNTYTEVPKIKMEGRWLEELGFSIGSAIVVAYGEGFLHIRTMTEEEQADREIAELEKEIKAGTASIKRLEEKLSDASRPIPHVAEAGEGYNAGS